LHALREDDFKRLFERLEQEEKRWQQALCIRLFFEFHVPMYKLMSACWAQIVDGCWYPYCPNEDEMRYGHHEVLTETERRVVKRILTLLRKDFGVSRYWFPSPFGRKPDHIKTVDGMWREALRDVGWFVKDVSAHLSSCHSRSHPSGHLESWRSSQATSKCGGIVQSDRKQAQCRRRFKQLR
jgi:hypothetical protein